MDITPVTIILVIIMLTIYLIVFANLSDHANRR